MGSSSTKGPVVYAVEWLDAFYDLGEYSSEELLSMHKPEPYTSVGLLLRSDEAGVMIATDIGSDGSFRGINFVPRAMVSREFALGPLKPPRKRTVVRPKASKLESDQGEAVKNGVGQVMKA